MIAPVPVHCFSFMRPKDECLTLDRDTGKRMCTFIFLSYRLGCLSMQSASTKVLNTTIVADWGVNEEQTLAQELIHYS